MTEIPGRARRRADQAQRTEDPGATRPAAASRPGRPGRTDDPVATRPAAASRPGRPGRTDDPVATRPAAASRPGRAGRTADSGAARHAAAGRRPGRASRSGRRGGDSGTREAILAAARALFGELGYDRTTIRRIAADAGVDAALVHHFYGTKDQLFAAAMRLPVNPREVLAEALSPGSRDQEQSLGEHLLRTVLGVWEVAEIRSTFLGLLRSAPTSEQAVVMLREFLAGAILGPLAVAALEATPGADGQDAGYRAALVASQVLGLGMTRYVLEVEPLAQASSEDLIAAIAPNLDRYLTGDLT